MGLISRTWRVISAKFNKYLTRAEDPVEQLDDLTIDSEVAEEMDSLRNEVELEMEPA